MKVAFVPHYGPPEVVELRDLPTPEPGRGQVRVRVLAAAVTAGDWRVRSGELPRGFGALRGLALGFGGPRRGVLGTAAAGVVDAVGEGVDGLAVGDEVVVFPGSDLGAHAEALVMPADGRIARKPAGWTFEEAASLPFGAMTALDFLDRGAVKAGERVLVIGASGAVGTAAVQLAKHLGAHVTGVCGAANASFVLSLGADEVIDAAEDWSTPGARAPWDVIVDTAGDAPYARARGVLAPGGRVLAVLADLPTTLRAPFVGRSAGHRVIAGPASEKPAYLRTIVDLAERGALRPVIDERFPFERIADAHRRVEARRKRGSVVVTLG